MKKQSWLKFVVFYHFVPTAATFYFLADYSKKITALMSPLWLWKIVGMAIAYIIACTVWGTVLYLFKK